MLLSRNSYRRSRVFTALIIVCLYASGLALANQTASIIGHWEGTITPPNGTLNISVDFVSAADGKLTATMSIPQQGARDMPLTGVSFNGKDVAFDLPNIPGDPKFRGTLSADGNKIEGTFSQGGGNMPAMLERKANPVAAAKDSLAGLDDVVKNAMKAFDVPGMAIAIVKNKEVVYAKGFGYKDVDKQAPVTADTLFAIGSVSYTHLTLPTSD